MDIAALLLVVAAIFAWGVISARAAVISTPIFFVAIGLLIAEGLRLIDLQPDPHTTKIIAEVTLVWVLFADASRVRFSDLREDLRYYVRLLAVGLPLTTALGTAAAVAILGLSPWYALLVGAALAPTDAALGSAVMSDRRVPYRVRQTLNVESGLNDGIATPIVTIAVAAIAAQVGLGHEGLGRGLTGLVLGALTGAVLGAVGGMLLRSAVGAAGVRKSSRPIRAGTRTARVPLRGAGRCKWFRRRLRGRKRIRRFRWQRRCARFTTSSRPAVLRR